tara:strand:- start:994 stop:1521 length:528 start_codon:yes stop_codon:yes gene_type:complete
MKTIKLRLRGAAPLLMNRYPTEKNPSRASAEAAIERILPSEEEYLNDALYIDEKGIYLPSDWIEAALRDAAKGFRQKGLKTYKEAIQSSVFLTEEKVRLKDPKWIPDRRPVTVQKARVVRVRPRFDSWETELFEITYNESRITKDRLLSIIEEAGCSKGIGDFRPKFGRFSVLTR